MRTPIQIASALLGAMLWTGSASAAGLQVTPVLVELSRAQKNAIITLRNDGAAPTRFQTNAVSWSQDESGQMKFAPTRDLVLFPQLLTLQPGEERNLRVGTTPDKFGTLEKSYRVFIEELPPPERPGGRPAVQVLTRLGIPVFLEPGSTVPSSRIEGKVDAGKLVFRLRNMGNVRLRPSEVTADARDGSGKAAGAHQRWDGWYVLAANDRVYEWPLPKDVCANVRTVHLEARFDQGEPVRADVAVPPGACPP